VIQFEGYMEQSTPTKPVMDVMPPKPAAAAPVLPPSDAAESAPGESNDSLTVHTAPPLSDDDKASTEAQKHITPTPKSEQKQKAAAHTAPPKPRGPAGAITAVVLGMIVLSALAILVYLNS